MRTLPLLLALCVAGCGESENDAQVADALRPANAERAPDRADAMPVRIGEMGPNFDACGGVGTTRRLSPGSALPVRAAPFEAAAETGAIAADGRFFVCTRSHDQRWLGVVWDQSGMLGEGCGVSSPIAARRLYEGPCRSGWVASALVKLVAG